MAVEVEGHFVVGLSLGLVDGEGVGELQRKLAGGLDVRRFVAKLMADGVVLLLVAVADHITIDEAAPYRGALHLPAVAVEADEKSLAVEALDGAEVAVAVLLRLIAFAEHHPRPHLIFEAPLAAGGYHQWLRLLG